MRILAAVVTHNRCALLSRCLDHIAAQDRAADTILVINNGSTDGTLDMLTHRDVEVVTQPNVGSAGGWHRAIAYALEHGFDAVWLMDDDGFPDQAALGHLARALGPQVACASSIVVQEDREERFVFPFPNLDMQGLPVIFGMPRKMAYVAQLEAICPDGTYPFLHFFNGALISCEAIRAVGNVERDFFLFGEEVDYFFRLRRGGKVFSVLAARHRHPDVSARPYSAMKVHYFIKNTLILNMRYFNARWLRHLLALGVVIWRVGRRNGWGDAASYVLGSKMGHFWGAAAAGLRGQVGKDFHG